MKWRANKESKKDKYKNIPFTKEQDFKYKAVMLIPFLFLLTIPFIYQIQWFNAFNNLEINYDFKNLDQIPPLPAQKINKIEDIREGNKYYSGNDVESLLYMFAYVISDERMDQIFNLTDTAQHLIDIKSPSIENIETQLEQEIQKLIDLYNYIQLIDSSLIKSFIEEIWQHLISELIPQSWYEPGNITIINNSWLNLENITIAGNFIINESVAPFIQFSNIFIEPNSQHTIQLSFYNLIGTFLNITIDYLVSLTFESILTIIEEGLNKPLKSFRNYIFDLFSMIKIDLSINFGADFGILPLSMVFSVNLTNIFNIIKENVLI